MLNKLRNIAKNISLKAQELQFDRINAHAIKCIHRMG